MTFRTPCRQLRKLAFTRNMNANSSLSLIYRAHRAAYIEELYQFKAGTPANIFYNQTGIT